LAGELFPGLLLAGELLTGEIFPGELFDGDFLPIELLAGELFAGELFAGELFAGDLLAGELFAGEDFLGERCEDLGAGSTYSTTGVTSSPISMSTFSGEPYSCCYSSSADRSTLSISSSTASSSKT